MIVTETNTRERLIECGIEAMTAKSYNACGLKEILDRAGVPKGSFYHYFKSKEDFGVAIIESFTQKYADLKHQILTDPDKTPIERLRAYFQKGRDWYAENGFEQTCLAAKLGMDVATLSQPMRIALKRGMDRWRFEMAQCIREAQEAGEIDPTRNADALAEFIFNAWEGTALHVQLAQSVEPIERFIENVFSELLRP